MTCSSDIDVVLARSPETPTLGARAANAGKHTIPYQIPLELGNRRKYVEQQPPRRSGRVDRLIEHDEVHAERLELCRQRYQVPHAARQSVELYDQHQVELPAAHVGK